MGGISKVTYWTATFIWDFAMQALFIIASCLILKGKKNGDIRYNHHKTLKHADVDLANISYIFSIWRQRLCFI